VTECEVCLMGVSQAATGRSGGGNGGK
jgi:hypothetical protein